MTRTLPAHPRPTAIPFSYQQCCDVHYNSVYLIISQDVIPTYRLTLYISIGVLEATVHGIHYKNRTIVIVTYCA